MLLVISFIVFMLLGVPLFGVIGLSSLVSMIGMPFPMEFIPQNLYTGMDQFPLIATIGFVMAGFLMEPAGITGEIIEVAKKAVGNVRGGLAMVTILACMIFAALSGSGPATTAAIGSIDASPEAEHFAPVAIERQPAVYNGGEAVISYLSARGNLAGTGAMQLEAGKTGRLVRK